MTTDINRSISGFRPSTPAVTTANLENVLAANPVVVAHFWAEWDGHDPVLDSHIQRIKPYCEARIHFVSCDVDSPENVEICKRCNVANIPFLAVIVDGEPRRGIMGLRSPELTAELEKRLTDWVAEKRWWRFWQCD